MLSIELLSAPTSEDLDQLAEVLHAAVHAGASVSFVLPFSIEEARAFWVSKLSSPKRRCLVARNAARNDGSIVGTVILDLDTTPNQQHRADVAKLLVHPDARRQGIARALMLALEVAARAEGRTLLTLDTRTGDSGEPLYLSLGYTVVGIIPRHARAPDSTGLESTTLMYKELGPE